LGLLYCNIATLTVCINRDVNYFILYVSFLDTTLLNDHLAQVFSMGRPDVYDGSEGNLIKCYLNISGVYIMATTSELRTIVQELDLVDIGDAASYLGEEAAVDDELALSETRTLFSIDKPGELFRLISASTQE
jgi:hypothetical protein